MAAFIILALLGAMFLVPAMLAWAVGTFVFGYRSGIAGALVYVANIALGIALMWALVEFVPLLSVLGRPDAWFASAVAIIAAILGTASAQRQSRPIRRQV